MFENYEEFKEVLDATVKTQGNQGAMALASLIDRLARTFWEVPDEEEVPSLQGEATPAPINQ